jgi:cell division septum initiation protein DivIVA
MPIKPEEITAENLPQGMRGYQRQATENLLKLVAWDYRRVLREHVVDAEELQRVRAHNDQLETEIQALRSLLDAQPSALQVQQMQQSQVGEQTADLEAEITRLRAQLATQSHQLETQSHQLETQSHQLDAQSHQLDAQSHQLDAQSHKAALSDTLLSSAIRSARELREQTREECDAVLKTARRRAQEIEGDARRSVQHASSDLERLKQMERDLREQLRRILESVIDRENPPARPKLPAPLPPEDTLTLPHSWTTGD